MSGTSVGGGRSSRKIPGLRYKRKRQRPGIRADMTAMVDIAFLLLIFYMVTTVFAKPQAIEVNLPPPSDEIVNVCDTCIVTIRIDEHNDCYWNLSEEMPVPIRAHDLRSLLTDLNQNNSKLNTLLIIHPEARFQLLVDVLDDIDLIERSFNADIASKLSIRIDDLFDPYHPQADELKERRFSYRYAMRSWEDGDSRLIARAAQENQDLPVPD